MCVKEKKKCHRHRCVFVVALSFLVPFSGYLYADDSIRVVYRSNGSAQSYRHRVIYQSGATSAPDTSTVTPAPQRPAPSASKPSPATYRVKKGDTLSEIAERCNCSVKEIMSLNNMKDSDHLMAGAVIKLPSGISGTTVSREGSPQFIWPVSRINSVVRDGSRDVASIGILIRTQKGAAITSAGTGKVQKIGYMRGFGTYCVVLHENRYATVYARLESVNVKTGDHVTKGQRIGTLGSADDSLHFQIDYAGRAKNPLDFLPEKS